MIGGMACAIGVCYMKNKYDLAMLINDKSFFICTGKGTLLPDIEGSGICSFALVSIEEKSLVNNVRLNMQSS